MVAADYPYVISTWMRSSTLGEHGAKRHKAIVRLRPAVEAMLARGRVLCAVSEAQPTTIHGWICTEMSGTLLYMFVPKDLKHQGIEELLFQTASAKPSEGRVA